MARLGVIRNHLQQNVLGYKQDQLVQIAHVEDYAAYFEKGIIHSTYLETESLRVFLAEHDGYIVYGDVYNLGGLGFVSNSNSQVLGCKL